MEDCSERSSIAPLLSAAEEAARGLSDSVNGRPDEMVVKTDARSFRGIASMLSQLSSEVRSCGGADCMGRKVDGFKFWVAHDQLVEAKRQLSMAEVRSQRLEQALRRIAELDVERAGEFIFFEDWKGLTSALRTLASETLGTSPADQGSDAASDPAAISPARIAA